MAKLYGKLNDNPPGRGTKQPDYKGSLRIGGFTGDEADEKNRECALWLKNVLEEYKEGGETWISLALWKREGRDGGDPYLSICLEDNSWKKSNPSFKKEGGDAFEL